MEQKIAQIIQKLKAVKAARGLSLSDIQNMIDNVDPGAVSMATLRRVFGESSDSSGFRYSSIQPIAAVMLGVEGEDDEFDPEKAKEYYLQRNALQDIVKFRAEQEEQLRSRLKEADDRHEKEKSEMSQLHDKNIDRLLSVQKEGSAAQAKAIDILERHVVFFRGTFSCRDGIQT